MLRLEGVSKRFGGLAALTEVGFTVEAGTIHAVIGPNGAGKTTLFNCIAGDLAPTSGRITFLDQRIDGRKPHQVARAGIARTFQNIKIFGSMTALENVMVGCHRLGRTGFPGAMAMLPRGRKELAAHRQRAMELLDLVGIADQATRPAGELAFGQQRAVELARGLATDPRLLLLDEPAAGLNMRETAELGRLITRIRDRGITVLLVEHDMSLVMEISDVVTVLNFGEKVAQGPPATVQNDPEVIKIYLGGDDHAQGA